MNSGLAAAENKTAYSFHTSKEVKAPPQPRVSYSNIQFALYCNTGRTFYFINLLYNECSTTVSTAAVLVERFTRCTCQIATSKHNPGAQKLMIAL